jgi:dTDP-4-amino-4,6-dideoxygalactose transaminase
MLDSNRTPFLDLVTPHQELKEELIAVFESALVTADFIGGLMVEGFERDFAACCETKYCVGVGSGTDALRFALIAAGIRPGDTVVTVPNTFIATAEAITQAGATPAFVDIDERTYNMDPRKLKEYLETSRKAGKRVTAAIPVHLYGQPADMDPILELAERHDLIVIEDACQAHGAEYFSRKESRWKKAGSMGRAAAFSFYPGKNLGACGEAGAVTTNDPEIALKIRMLRDHGQARKYYHEIEGYNGRLDALQAGLLDVKLRHLAKWNEQRRAAAKRYNELFRGNEPVQIPFEPPYSKPVYHLYVVRVQGREALQKQLSGAGIATGIHYPIPLHQQKAYENLGYKTGDFPVTEKLVPEIVSLPMFPSLTAEQQQRVVSEIRDFVSASVV